jgi:16S rRNA C967 or C1407 C5-methylase (RsmB/RsmF family)
MEDRTVLASLAGMTRGTVCKGKGFNPESFDRILLDPSCSALGLRPK